MTDRLAATNRWMAIFGSKPFIYAVIAWLALIAFELICLPQTRQVFYFQQHWEQGNYLRIVALLALTAASALIELAFFCVAFSSGFWIRLLCFLVFGLVVSVEYACYRAFGRFSVTDDFALALFAGDWSFTSGAVAMYANPLALVPIAIFGILLFINRDSNKGTRPVLLWIIGVLVFFAGATYFTANLFHTNSIAAFFRTGISFPVNWYLGSIHGIPERWYFVTPRDPVAFQSPNVPKNNVIFIVDESVRGDHLSLNGYGKPTTQYLEELRKKGFIKNWGIASSGTTCSVSSNSLLLTGVNELPDRDFNVYKWPTLFRMAKAMNYKTYFFDGQVSNLWNGKPSDVNDYGTWVKRDEIAAGSRADYDIDAEIARRVREIVGNSTGNFIWISKFGVHKPYSVSYPNETGSTETEGWFTTYNPETDPQILINSYDKAIAYNSQSFFSELIKDEPADNSFYLYTSDHGQTLRENGATVSHCSTTRPEAIVPLFLIAQPGLLPNSDERFRASHANLFSTVLDLFDFPASERPHQYSPSLLTVKEADSAKRYYYTGNLHNPAAGAKYAFD